MSKSVETFSPLSEELRLVYLDAMQVPLWVPRSDMKGENKTSINQSQNREIFKDNFKEELEAEQLENTSELKGVSQVKEKEDSSDFSTQYLKMINWKQNSSADRKLLIICRHQKDQPAQSFATTSSPSQFMRDYIQSINELLNRATSSNKSTGSNNKADLKIQANLGHLTQAGLSDDCQAIESLVERLNPDLILLLGDEGIAPLLKSESKVADVRGKFHHFYGRHLLVSYHPYSLIQDSQLKKLALQDLVLLTNYFINL